MGYKCAIEIMITNMILMIEAKLITPTQSHNHRLNAHCHDNIKLNFKLLSVYISHYSSKYYLSNISPE